MFKIFSTEANWIADLRILYFVLMPNNHHDNDWCRESRASRNNMAARAPNNWRAFFNEGTIELIAGRRDQDIPGLSLPITLSVPSFISIQNTKCFYVGSGFASWGPQSIFRLYNNIFKRFIYSFFIITYFLFISYDFPIVQVLTNADDILFWRFVYDFH